MKSKFITLLLAVLYKLSLSDVVADDAYRRPDLDSIHGYNYLPLVLGVLFAAGIFVFLFQLKKENSSL